MNAHALAERADGVHGARRRFAEHGQGVAEQRELGQPRVNRLEHGRAFVPGQAQFIGRLLVFRLQGIADVRASPVASP